MLATWVSGWLNCLEYWMNAWHGAQGQRARCHLERPDHGHQDVVEVSDEHHRRLDRARDELRPVAGVVQRVVVLGEGAHGLLALAERP